MANWSTTTKHEPSSINNGRRYELRDRVSIEQLNNMTENSFYAMETSSVAKEKAEEALKFAQGSGTTVYENGSPVAEFNADKKVDVAELENYYTKGQVDALIESGGSADVDLSNYYTKQETYSKQEVDDKLANLDVDIDFSDYYTKGQTNQLLENKADKVALDTTNSKVTELQDDVGTLKIDNASNKTSITNLGNLKADKTEVESLQQTKADKSEIPYVGNFITRAVDDLVNYYTKADTYSQAEVRQLISAIPKFNIEVVTGFPTNPSETTIYLLRATTGESGNLYSEYIYVNGIWEKLGEQKLDLSGYATTESVNEAIKGLKTEITSGDLLTSDMVYDFNQTKKFVTEEEKTYWNGKVNVDVSNLTNYYKKAETYTKTETQDLLDAGLSTKANKSELESYVTKTGLESTLVSKGYLTQDALNGYATESYVSTSVAGLDSQLRTLINNKANVSALNSLEEEVGNVAYNLSTVRNKYLKSVFVSDDGKTLQIYDQDNKAILFNSGGYDDSEIRGLINEKVDKETGKGLSTNDYTTAEKNKLAGLSNYTAGNGISIENGVIGVEKSAIIAELSNNYGIPAINTKFNLTLNQVLNVGNKLAFINNKIKIVGDVSFIKATAKVVVNTSGAGNLHMYINKNGTSFAVTPNTMVHGVNSISIPNVLINAQQGDELDFSLHSAVGGTVQGASYRTYLMVEVIK